MGESDLEIYVEGGGDTRALKSKCQNAFRELIKKAVNSGKMPRINPCGGRIAAFKKFC
jgi:hypothetical protein